MKELHVLNLGAGVQSTTMLLLACEGRLPKPDAVIFADTGWEPREVYDHLEWLTAHAEGHGIEIHKVSNGNIKGDALRSQVRGDASDGGRWASMPYHVQVGEAPTGGMIRRQCTAEYKIQPIEKFVRSELLGLKPRQRWPKDVIGYRWMGISFDERQRCREGRGKTGNIYPLAGIRETWNGERFDMDFKWLPLGKRWTRETCRSYLEESYPARIVPRSACIGCPFHSNDEWRRMRDTDPESWDDAVEFDKSVRKCGGMRGDVFLHRSLKPLDEANIDATDDVDGQTVFGFINECEGLCGL